MRRFVLWQGLDEPRFEAVELQLGAAGLVARGTQVGCAPEPYRADYELDASEGFITRSLEVRVTADGWQRRLTLRHDGKGDWSWNVDARGDCKLPGPGAPTSLSSELSEALDCDLGLSPLTNMLPLRRLRLAENSGGVDLVTAWVSVPDLGLHSYPQRYELLRATSEGSLVRFIDRGLSAGFTAELQYDRDGVVELYPELARRVPKRPP